MSRRSRVALVSIIAGAGLTAGIFYLRPMPLPPEPERRITSSWATPIEIEGVSNFFKVTDHLYRGEQPTAEGMRNLEKMGIKTVINLRLSRSDTDEIAGTGLGEVHIRVEAWDPDEDEVVQFLEVATDPRRQPVFVHCRHGADRTGMMCAIYRMVACGWNREDAILEMTRGDFGYHRIWKDIVRYLERVDVRMLRREAGVGEPPGP